MGKAVIHLARHSQYPPHEPALWDGTFTWWDFWVVCKHENDAVDAFNYTWKVVPTPCLISTQSLKPSFNMKALTPEKNIHTSILQFTSCICHAIRYPWWEVMGRGGSQWHYLWATACSRKSPFTQVRRLLWQS